jgi:hypothetical protein
MRRYRLQVHADPGPASVVVGWDPGERHYASDVTHRDGRTRHRTYAQLRELIFTTHSVAVLDDLLLRALLKDRRAGSGGAR